MTGQAVAGTRPAPGAGELVYRGSFAGARPGSSGVVDLRISPDGQRIWQIEGDVPARCKQGLGPPEFGVLFSTVAREFPIRKDGIFTVKQTTTYEGRLQILVKGEFVGREVRGTASIHQRWIKLDCQGSRSCSARRPRS